MNKNDFDVIVVGAGIAGLVAARHLIKNKMKVAVLEARNRVGGRIFSVKTPRGKIVDLGAQWVGEGQTKLQSLLSEYSIEIFPDKHKGNNLLFLDGVLSSYTKEIPILGLNELVDLFINLYRIEKDCQNIPSVPYQAKFSDKWDGMSVDSWAKMHIHTESVLKILELYMESIYAVSPKDMSFLFFLATLHTAMGPLYGIEKANAYRVKGGLVQLCEKIAEELGDSIALSAPVMQISQTSDQVIVATEKQTYSARKVIVAVPPNIANQIRFSPQLPHMRDKLHQRMPMGSVVQITAIYKKPFWREKGLSGKVVNEKGPIRIIYDESPIDDSYGVLVGYILGNSVFQVDKSSPLWIQKTAMATFAQFFGNEANHPEEILFYDWNEDPWTRGGYACYMPTGVMTALDGTVTEPSGHIHWASTEMASQWHGYIEGAIESGLNAANQILDATQR